MKQILFISIGILISTIMFAQAPEAFNYQGVARDLSGNPLSNQEIGLQVSILEGAVDGVEVYKETHQVTTTNLGLFHLQIGRGEPLNASLSDIDWSNGSHFLQIEMDQSGGSNYQLIGTSELLSVPYALYAKSTKPVDLGNGLERIDGIIENTGDLDSLNELQLLEINGANLSISNGNTVVLPQAEPIELGNGLEELNGVIENTGDLDSLNELQLLELDGTNLSITNGNTIELPVNNLWTKEEVNIRTDFNAKIVSDSMAIADSLVSQLNLLSDGGENLMTLGNNDGNNWYVKKHYTSYLEKDTCLLITTDTALSKKSWVNENYQKYGLKIYPDGGLATPNLTFGDYRFGDHDESHPVSMYYGSNPKYTTGASSDNWPNFYINAHDNHIIFKSQYGTSFYGGIILKSNGGKCFKITIDDNGDFQKKEVNCQ